jgi:hypothetical protein
MTAQTKCIVSRFGCDFVCANQHRIGHLVVIRSIAMGLVTGETRYLDEVVCEVG